MSIIVVSSKAGFESASALAEMLDCKYENPYETENRNYTQYDVVFKYGFSRPIKTKKGAKVFNKTESTNVALDKLKTFDLLKEDGVCVAYTLDLKQAAKWLKTDGYVIARSTATGHNSEGVTFCTDAEDLLNADAKFFTKYVDHTNEYRINCWRNSVISVYDKVEKNEEFTFKLFKGVEEHPQLVSLVQKVYDKTKLDWFGLDVLRDKQGNLTILEINSAPILYPHTLKKLTTIIEKEAE
jgi:glutathione synthase/RimK-type ligase-like ATP-grasp enzyme